MSIRMIAAQATASASEIQAIALSHDYGIVRFLPSAAAPTD
jgi:hypothetical protein